jgi:exopolysaccharide biosynthesis predicted pyruvyltransferase EpsI
MRALLPFKEAGMIFEPLAGKKVGLIHSKATGNCGDRLIEASSEQLLTAFGLDWRVVEPDRPEDREILLCFGGGNYGHPYCTVETQRRAKALATGLPCVLLPQTVYGVEIHKSEWHQAWVRDATSQRLLYGSRLAPDLAMFYDPTSARIEPTEGVCYSFSTDYEAMWAGRGPDLRYAYADPELYLMHVAKHREVVTDCLHIGICGMIANRRVTLLPTKLHKNRSIFETWLRRYGCQWADTPP